METRVLIRSYPKPNAVIPPPQWCSWWNLIMIGQLVSETFMLYGRTHGRRLESHTISSPWAFGSGELKMKELEWSQGLPHYNPMGAICCHGNQSSDMIWPKTLWSQSPTSMMLLMKFDYDQPADLSDIHVWMCGQTDGRTDAHSTPIL